jgi:hypothetical protein
MIDMVPVAIEDSRNGIPMPVTQANIILFGERYGHEVLPAKWGQHFDPARSALIVNCAEDYSVREFNSITAQKGKENHAWSIANHYNLNYWAIMTVYTPRIGFSQESMSLAYAALKSLPSQNSRRALLSTFTNVDELPFYYSYCGETILSRVNRSVREKAYQIRNFLRR